jgi:PadR family transcriptional regulator PadR
MEPAMSQREFPGEFEQVVLLTLARLKGQAYGMAIRQEIADRAGRDVGIGSVYSALDRMEAKGFISSTLGDPTPERGGKAKRYYQLEGTGVLALERVREMFARLWDGLVLDDGAYQ